LLKFCWNRIRGRSGRPGGWAGGQAGQVGPGPPGKGDRVTIFIDPQRLAQAGIGLPGRSGSGEPGHLGASLPIVSASSAAQEVGETSATDLLASYRGAVNWPWRASSFVRAREAGTWSC
jgi:hypothetical protein